MSQGPTTISFVAAVPQFAVPDLVRTAEYYRDVLGFQIAGWDGERVSLVADTDPVFAIVWRDEVQVFFNRADQPNVRTDRAEDAPDVYLRVIGIDALAEELPRRGADMLDGPEDRIYGQREFVVKDCNGLILLRGGHEWALILFGNNSHVMIQKMNDSEISCKYTHAASRVVIAAAILSKRAQSNDQR